MEPDRSVRDPSPLVARVARRSRNPHAHHPWTVTEEELLRAEVIAGIDLEQVAVGHGRTVTAIRRRLTLLGLIR